MSQPKIKPLTKSRFKTGYQCPTKLYYTARPGEYGNTKDDNEFLKALAEGGYQVGELAMLYHPGGVKIDTLDYAESVRQTDELLKKENVTIFEAAFQFESLFVRVDVLVKKGNVIELTEVKAKSVDGSEPFEVFAKNALKKGEYRLTGKWDEYVLDLAFQTYVLRKAKPQFTVDPGLMLADKSVLATADGLNQLFLIKRISDRQIEVVHTKDVQLKDLGQRLLKRIPLAEEIDLIITKAKLEWVENFEELVAKLAKVQASGERFAPHVGSQCKNCEFRIKREEGEGQLKSGFEECWMMAKKLKPSDFKRQFVFDVWDFRGTQNAIDEGKLFASQLSDADLKVGPRTDDKIGLSRSERQYLQVQFEQGALKVSASVYAEGLSAELKELKPPYHFIDFETAMVAIPFHKGRAPYEQMAYQFSHHIVGADGQLLGHREYLDTRRGVFPNFDFVRALKKSLEGDEGVVFRFAAHENTVLNQIHEQLARSEESDRDELRMWIESLTTPGSKCENPWTPTRQFVDMRDLTLRHYYLPETKGSNSIKKVLPAVLNLAGQELAKKFPDHIRFDEAGKIMDPYKNLPPIFNDVDKDEMAKMEARLIEREDLNDGGAAMLAWARMQFTEMSKVEREALAAALLRYCHLDTLAMVIIWEWWMFEIRKAGPKAA